MSSTTAHQNEGRHSKYFHIMLNMADDDLDPFEYRLLGHYICICGKSPEGLCYETLRTTSATTRMSVPKVIDTRKSLEAKGWISVTSKQRQSTVVKVIDRMAENIGRYATRDTDNDQDDEGAPDQDIDHADQDIDHADQYPAIYKDKKIKEEEQAQPASPTPKPVRPRNTGYDMVACQYLGKELDSPGFYSLGGRIAQHAKWCNGQAISVTRKDDDGGKHTFSVPAPSRPVTPELLARIRKRYAAANELKFLPRDILKFVELVEDELKRAAAVSQQKALSLSDDEKAELLADQLKMTVRPNANKAVA